MAIADDTLFILMQQSDLISLIRIPADIEGGADLYAVGSLFQMATDFLNYIGMVFRDGRNGAVYWMVDPHSRLEGESIAVRVLEDGVLSEPQPLDHDVENLGELLIWPQDDGYLTCIEGDESGLSLGVQAFGDWRRWELPHRYEGDAFCHPATENLYLSVEGAVNAHQLFRLPNIVQAVLEAPERVNGPVVEGPFGVAVHIRGLQPDHHQDRVFVPGGETRDLLPPALLQEFEEDGRDVQLLTQDLLGSTRVDEDTWAYFLRLAFREPRILVVHDDGASEWVTADFLTEAESCGFHVLDREGVLVRTCIDEVWAIDLRAYLHNLLSCDAETRP